MARIDVLPSIEIIRGFKGILDFYLWRGLPCVRAWPKYRPANQTPASLAAALTFGAVVKAYALLANLVLETYREDALDQPRTARDIMVTGVFGNLHEATMSDFLDALIIIRDAVVSLTDLLHALDSIDTDEIVVNVDQSVLPPLAATTTNQATQITALQKLDDLQDTLESVALDRLLVRGMDQLFSFKSRHHSRPYIANAVAGTNIILGPIVPPGELWIITAAGAMNQSNGCSAIQIGMWAAGIDKYFSGRAPVLQNEVVPCQHTMILAPGDRVTATYLGCILNDTLLLGINGYVMTLET